VPTLIESELFGYVKGAFTGATQSKDGLMAMAEGGTIFLDEVGELPVDLQAKMLRAIQEKEIRPVGSTKQIPINVRILAATNRDLEQAVTQGSFRRDLYFRLNVLSLRIPALRERRQDIPLLIGHFLERMTRTSGQEKVLSDDALKAAGLRLAGKCARTGELPGAQLRLHQWPHNSHHRFAARDCQSGGAAVIEWQWKRERERLLEDHSDRRVGEADHLAHHHGTQWRQAAGGEIIGHRQDDALSQAEGLRGARVLKPVSKLRNTRCEP
jgi:Sigma-54 interaction domain